jgi:hypothetical protein
MQLADTKTVRKLVNRIVGASAIYTDMGANGTRLLAWEVYGEDRAEQLVKEVKELFTLLGFTNRVKMNSSVYNPLGRSGGQTWLRINASYKD